MNDELIYALELIYVESGKVGICLIISLAAALLYTILTWALQRRS